MKAQCGWTTTSNTEYQNVSAMSSLQFARTSRVRSDRQGSTVSDGVERFHISVDDREREREKRRRVYLSIHGDRLLMEIIQSRVGSSRHRPARGVNNRPTTSSTAAPFSHSTSFMSPDHNHVCLSDRPDDSNSRHL